MCICLNCLKNLPIIFFWYVSKTVTATTTLVKERISPFLAKPPVANSAEDRKAQIFSKTLT